MSSNLPSPAARLRDPYRVLIREVSPVTPMGEAPKTVVDDTVEFSALLVAEGHGLLGAQLRWRPADSEERPRPKWTTVAMRVDPSGRATAQAAFDRPGRYEFEVRAWADEFGTWRHDLP